MLNISEWGQVEPGQAQSHSNGPNAGSMMTQISGQCFLHRTSTAVLTVEYCVEENTQLTLLTKPQAPTTAHRPQLWFKYPF